MNRIAVLIVLFLVVLVLPGALYTLNETEQAIITQFGDPVGEPITEPGLHVKVPWIQVVNRFDKRWLQ
ncbi:MAG TPA: SPFH domain-containing protein, partial [Vicinamibacteria bacterium]|nr:SPFH domain-containing protein [Vicinamibacteria bacterium]